MIADDTRFASSAVGKGTAELLLNLPISFGICACKSLPKRGKVVFEKSEFGANMGTLTIRSSQKVFTEDEVSGLTGICLEHLRVMARSRHLGFLRRAAEASAGLAEAQVEKWLYTDSDLMVLVVLHPRCEH